MVTQILRWLGWALPPASFFVWLLWTMAGRQAAVPAFGPVEPHLEALRWSLIAKLGLGASLLVGWTGCWTFLRRSRRGMDSRRMARSREYGNF